MFDQEKIKSDKKRETSYKARLSKYPGRDLNPYVREDTGF
jgi:hypothetical protein